MTNRRLRREKRRSRYSSHEDVNPMNYVSNLSDVMLILAVGIMLALIIHWNVEIEPTKEETKTPENQAAIEFSGDDLQDMDNIPEDMEHMGEVFYDATTGKYYIIQQSE